MDLLTAQHLQRWIENRTVSTTIKNGDDLEKIVQKVCERIGVPDLVSMNPKVSKTNSTKEIADALVVLGNKMLAFQVKQRAIDSAKELTTITGRVEGLIEDSVSQFNILLGLIQNQTLPPIENLRGNNLQLPQYSDLDLVCVSIAAFPGVASFPDEKKFEVKNGYKNFRGTLVHIFDVDVFDKISLELDTLPDLLGYLETRKNLIENHLIGDLYELDLLALYKLNPAQIREVLSQGPGTRLILSPGMWEDYIKNHGVRIVERNQANALSYFVDAVLQGSHRSIGEEFQGPSDLSFSVPSGTVEAHFGIATALASIKRLYRRGIGEAFHACLHRADENLADGKPGFAFRFVGHKEELDSGYVILSVVDGTMSREERGRMLYNICCYVYVAKGLKSIVGIATESARSSARSEDFMHMKDVTFDEETKARLFALSKKLMGPESGATVQEFGP